MVADIREGEGGANSSSSSKRLAVKEKKAHKSTNSKDKFSVDIFQYFSL